MTENEREALRSLIRAMVASCLDAGMTPHAISHEVGRALMESGARQSLLGGWEDRPMLKTKDAS